MASLDYYNAQYLSDLLSSLRPRLEGVLRRYQVPSRAAGTMLEEVAAELVYRNDGIIDPGRWLVSRLRGKCRRYWVGRRQLVWQAVDRLYSRG